MLSQNIYYQEERKHASDRFVVMAVLTLVAFVLSGQSAGEIAENALLSGFVLLVVDLVSIAHYYFITHYPETMVQIRKQFLVLVDVGLLTFFILLFGESGLYFLPLYIVIVMRSGLNFGVNFFYVSLFLVSLSWLVLYVYSPYWQENKDVLATFAMTTFLIPLFYLKLVLRVHEENTELSQTLNEVVYDANYDELTGVANRKQYKKTIMELIENKTPFTLLFIDLNKFKVINDTHGHHVGDHVLKEVARRLTENVDKEDFVARLGGDEFVVITLRNKAFLEKFIENLERNVIGRHKVGSIIVPIELSIGISRYPEEDRTAMMLAKYADEAMYTAKKDPNRYHYFYHEITDEQKAEYAKK